MVVRRDDERAVIRGAVTILIGLAIGALALQLFGCEKEGRTHSSVRIDQATPTEKLSIYIDSDGAAIPPAQVKVAPSVLIVPAPFPINAECSPAPQN